MRKHTFFHLSILVLVLSLPLLAGCRMPAPTGLNREPLQDPTLPVLPPETEAVLPTEAPATSASEPTAVTAPVETAAVTAPPAETAAAVTTEAPAATAAVTEAPAVTQASAATQAPAATEAPVTAATAAPAPQDWLRYINVPNGYSLSYPPEWGVCFTGRYSIHFCRPESEPGPGLPPVLQVSVIPAGESNPDDFITPDAYRAYQALPAGEAQLTEPEAQPPEYFSYTRLPDATVSGRQAAVIENSRVWEAPPEMKDRRVFIIAESGITVFNTYYRSPEELAAFETVLSTVQFTQ